MGCDKYAPMVVQRAAASPTSCNGLSDGSSYNAKNRRGLTLTIDREMPTRDVIQTPGVFRSETMRDFKEKGPSAFHQ